ncbi:MAG: copper resistance protein CopC [Acidimicrobiales bacterium]|nr:copper resistance protein CopC [Acidimicrobiales bacterium]
MNPPSFGEPVEIDFGSLRVIGPGGRRVDSGGTHHPDGDSHAVAISLPSDLPRGTYVVAWRVISADSHPVHGAFVFSVGTASGAAKATDQPIRQRGGGSHLLARPRRRLCGSPVSGRAGSSCPAPVAGGGSVPKNRPAALALVVRLAGSHACGHRHPGRVRRRAPLDRYLPAIARQRRPAHPFR